MTARDSEEATNGEARRFLLGQLSAAEAERFEERLLASDELFAKVQTAEDDLFDAFSRESLTSDERRSFIERFGGQQQRIAFARTLDRKLRGQNVIPLRSERRVPARFLFAAAASIIVFTGAILLWRSQPAASTAKEASVPVVTTSTGISTAIASAPLAASTATLEIALVGTRGADGAPRLVLSPASREIELRIRLNPADRFPAYAVLIRRGDGSTLWQGRATAISPGRIDVRIPASGLASGDYEIAVAGIREGRPEEDLGFKTITVTNRSLSP